MVRVDAAGDVAEPQLVERESCGVWLPRVSRRVLEFPRYDSLHCPANGCLFCCPESESEEAIPTWPETYRGGVANDRHAR